MKGTNKLIEDVTKTAKQAQDAATTATQNIQTTRQHYYTPAVGTASLVEGALGKNHPLAVKLLGLRRHLVGHQNPDGGNHPAPPTANG